MYLRDAGIPHAQEGSDLLHRYLFKVVQRKDLLFSRREGGHRLRQISPRLGPQALCERILFRLGGGRFNQVVTLRSIISRRTLAVHRFQTAKGDREFPERGKIYAQFTGYFLLGWPPA